MPWIKYIVYGTTATERYETADPPVYHDDDDDDTFFLSSGMKKKIRDNKLFKEIVLFIARLLPFTKVHVWRRRRTRALSVIVSPCQRFVFESGTFVSKRSDSLRSVFALRPAAVIYYKY